MVDWLLATDMGCPGPKGAWPLWLSIAYLTANCVIGLSYLAVPVIIVRNWKYRREGISGVRLWLVMAFLPAQAVSRLARVGEVGGPCYKVTAIFDIVAAITAAACVFNLRNKILHILQLPSREQIRDLNNKLQAEILEREVREQSLRDAQNALKRKLDEAEKRISRLVDVQEDAGWWVSRKEALREVDHLLTEIGGGHV